MVLLMNFGEEDFSIERGIRIAQLVIQKYETIEWNKVDSLDYTSRLSGGYGSTGIR
jgi:dUTP pyrophosphatase